MAYRSAATGSSRCSSAYSRKHQAHHDGERAPVDLARLDLAEQCAAGLAVQPGQLADQELHRLADLEAEGVGDVGLRFGALREQGG